MADPPASPPPEPDLTGQTLGDLEILRRLGEGAMAVVYLAQQRSLRRQVAVKVLKSRLAADATYVRRFQREAQAAAALVHANIVQIHDVGQIGGVYYIVQEYAEGLNLRQWLTRHGPLDLRMALVLLRQVAAALAKAAGQGIVHRDIKPKNIIFTRSGEVKVADFGLARLLDEGTDLTQAGMTLGTPLYMSPEQVEGRPLDVRSDIYALGVTSYQMLSGAPPFAGQSALSVALQHLKKAPEPLESQRPDLPAALCRAVHKMMAKDPADRFQSPQELLGEVREIQAAHLAGEAWPEDLPLWTPEPGQGPPTSRLEATQRLETLMRTQSLAAVRPWRWWPWAAAAAVAFVAAGALALSRTHRPSVMQVDSAVPLEATAEAQWIRVSLSGGTEEGWRSIIESFPENVYAVNHARQQLARIYLREESYASALKQFKALSAEEDAEFRAFGLAGQCGVLVLEARGQTDPRQQEEKYREAAGALAELWPLRAKLRDEQLKLLVQFAERAIRSKGGAGATNPEWKKWLDRQVSDRPKPPA